MAAALRFATLLALAAVAHAAVRAPGARAVGASRLLVSSPLLVEPRRRLPVAAAAAALTMISREDEEEGAFLSAWEKKSDGDKVASPAVLIGLGAIILPFIVGIIVLGTGGFGNN
jgi:hypothetical protein